MLYLIGLGLNQHSLTHEGKLALKKCKKIYLESYTVSFPYTPKELELTLARKITLLTREKVESDFLIKEAKKQAIALLVYGSPLFATTHSTLLEDCLTAKVKTKVLLNASVFDALSLTGLHVYKFGKIASMPQWEKNFTPDSFLDIVKENKKTHGHSLILIDIDLTCQDAISQLQTVLASKKMSLDKLLICSKMGTTHQKIHYNTLKVLKQRDIPKPFCIIIPAKLHFTEESFLKFFS